MAIKQILVLPSDPHALSEIRNCIKEISNAMSRAEGEKDYIKSAIEDICEKYDLPKGEISALANAYHKDNRGEIVAKAQTLDENYDKLFVLKNSENQGTE
mgnify:CR=1 FL=1